MSHDGMFLALARSAGDLAGVFEHDGNVGYFYLYHLYGDEGEKVIGAIRVAGQRPALREDDVRLAWSPSDGMVAIFLREQMCAVFDCDTGETFGGDCSPGSPPAIPDEVRTAFAGLAFPA